MTRFEKRLTQYFLFAVAVMLVGRAIFTGGILEWFGKGITPIVIMLVTIYLIEPMVKAYQKWLKGRRTMAVAFSFITILLMIVGFISIILPSIKNSVDSIVDRLPNSTYQISQMILSLPFAPLFIDEQLVYDFFNNFSEIFITFRENIISYSTSILISFKDAIISVGIFILSLLMAFYALKDYERIGENIEFHMRSLLGEDITDPIIRVFHMTDKSMKKFLVGKLYTCLFLGVTVAVLGLIFNLISPKHIPYLPLIAFIIGLTNIIPYVGPFIGTVPSLVFALLNGFLPAAGLLGVVLVAQQIDNILISPKIIGESVGLKPFWVIFSVTVGGRLFGILGMLLTVPITSVVLVLLEERGRHYKERHGL